MLVNALRPRQPVFLEFRKRLVDRLSEQLAQEENRNKSRSSELKQLQEDQEHATTETYNFQQQLANAQRALASFDGTDEQRRSTMAELEQQRQRHQTQLDELRRCNENFANEG